MHSKTLTMTKSSKKTTPITAGKKVEMMKKKAAPAKSKTATKPVAKSKKVLPKSASSPKNSTVKKSATGNKELDKMLALITEATKRGDKKVTVFTTNESHHKASKDPQGFGVEDLKPKLLEAYKHLFCKFDVSTKVIYPREKAVEWIVNIKK